MNGKNYQEILDFLYAQLPMYQRTGAAAYKADLNNTLELCKMLENPENEIPAIHVAGTNGKGSVSHMLASALMEQGYKTGLYTSPHLTDFRERITINGAKIPKEKVIEFVENYKNTFQAIKPSFFELTFAMALDYFHQQKVNIAVFETGMGGRLDSTNVVKPVISVITNIGHDHQQFLGDTIEKIAKEKAGIIKANVPVIIGKTQTDTAPVFTSAANTQKAPILFADEHIHTSDEGIIESENYNYYRKLRIHSSHTKVPENINSALTGLYQKENIVTALAAMVMLQNTNFPVSTTSIRHGMQKVIKNTNLRGRWQILGKNPLTICDTGHNKEGLESVLEMIKQQTYSKLHIVMGVVNDKNAGEILKLFPKDAGYYICKANIPRSMDENKLAEIARKNGLAEISAFGTVKDAFLNAQKKADQKDMIFIGGSTFVVADLLEYLEK